jgi:hypothetical protein
MAPTPGLVGARTRVAAPTRVARSTPVNRSTAAPTLAGQRRLGHPLST